MMEIDSKNNFQVRAQIHEWIKKVAYWTTVTNSEDSFVKWDKKYQN